MFRNREKIVSSDIAELYNQYEKNLYLKRFKVVLIIAFIFVSLFGILDFIVYGNSYRPMWFTRIVGDIVVLISLLVYQKLQKHIRLLSYLAVTGFYLCINTIIFFTKQGASSPYYAGLTLSLVALSTIIPWNGKNTALVAIENIILYLITISICSISNHQQIDVGLLMNNLFFMISTSTFCVAAKALDAKLRYDQFCLNYELKNALKNLQQTEGQLLHSEKLNAIGSLTAGLLHEINNPLNYASMAISMAKQDSIIKENQNLRDYVDDIEDGVNRVTSIVKDLKSFAHPTKDNKTDEFKVADIVERARKFTSSEMQDINFNVNISDNLLIKASENHMVQVFVNLITNACRAIIKKGNKDGNILITAKEIDQSIIIEINDNGIGISANVVNKIFEPFYTTREAGEGLGLGLSICYTILKNHNATISVNSEESKGTQFILTFPKP